MVAKNQSIYRYIDENVMLLIVFYRTIRDEFRKLEMSRSAWQYATLVEALDIDRIAFAVLILIT